MRILQYSFKKPHFSCPWKVEKTTLNPKLILFYSCPGFSFIHISSTINAGGRAIWEMWWLAYFLFFVPLRQIRNIPSFSKRLVCELFGTHPHAHRTKIAMCVGRTPRHFLRPHAQLHRYIFSQKFSKFFTKNESVRTCGAHPHLRGVHALTGTHISEKNLHLFAQKLLHPHVCAHAHTHAH